MHQTVEEQTGTARTAGNRVRTLHLPEDLRFPDNHGIKAAGNPENMAYRVTFREGVQIRLKARRLEMMVVVKEIDESVGAKTAVLGVSDDLHSIAG